MHRACTMEARGCTLDAQLMLFECTTDAPRIYSHVLRMFQECLKGAPQMHFGCTRNVSCMLMDTI